MMTYRFKYQGDRVDELMEKALACNDNDPIKAANWLRKQKPTPSHKNDFAIAVTKLETQSIRRFTK